MKDECSPGHFTFAIRSSELWFDVIRSVWRKDQGSVTSSVSSGWMRFPNSMKEVSERISRVNFLRVLLPWCNYSFIQSFIHPFDKCLEWLLKNRHFERDGGYVHILHYFCQQRTSKVLRDSLSKIQLIHYGMQEIDTVREKAFNSGTGNCLQELACVLLKHKCT